MKAKKEKALTASLAAVLCAGACAHIPASLEDWAMGKALKVGDCAAKVPKTKEEFAKCMGPNYLRDLGTEACDQAHQLIEELPGD